jgi:hypothetical protein
MYVVIFRYIQYLLEGNSRAEVFEKRKLGIEFALKNT